MRIRFNLKNAKIQFYNEFYNLKLSANKLYYFLVFINFYKKNYDIINIVNIIVQSKTIDKNTLTNRNCRQFVDRTVKLTRTKVENHQTYQSDRQTETTSRFPNSFSVGCSLFVHRKPCSAAIQ